MTAEVGAKPSWRYGIAGVIDDFPDLADPAHRRHVAFRFARVTQMSRVRFDTLTGAAS